MQTRTEAAAWPPVPLFRRPGGEVRGRDARADADREPRCEMCGATVIAHHCKRICLRCGFMTGCSEGI
ncbi:MAG: hypothetical protein NDJ94_05470 [Vicinamibacteria bacterium]|nr:hypothetical protein [Vicinamibacteria bacterium]